MNSTISFIFLGPLLQGCRGYLYFNFNFFKYGIIFALVKNTAFKEKKKKLNTYNYYINLLMQKKNYF